jgi:hypothetical protein
VPRTRFTSRTGGTSGKTLPRPSRRRSSSTVPCCAKPRTRPRSAPPSRWRARSLHRVPRMNHGSRAVCPAACASSTRPSTLCWMRGSGCGRSPAGPGPQHRSQPRQCGYRRRALGRTVDRPDQHPRPLQALPPTAVGGRLNRGRPTARGRSRARLSQRRERGEKVRPPAPRSLPARRSAPQSTVRARRNQLDHLPPRPARRRPCSVAQADSRPLPCARPNRRTRPRLCRVDERPPGPRPRPMDRTRAG